MICRHCGKEIADNSRNCLYCGKEQEDAAPQHEETVNSVGKHTLYKAAQASPQRPSTLAAAKKSEKNENRRKRRITAGIIVWLIVLGIVVGGGYAIGLIFRDPSSSVSNNPPKDSSDAADLLETVEHDIPDRNLSQNPPSNNDDESAAPVVNYPVEGIWQWSSETKAYKDTIWKFGNDGRVTVYYIGSDSVDYKSWPETYEYDESTGILNTKAGAFHLVWDSENQFSIGKNVAIGINESVIPSDAVIVNGKKTPDTPDNVSESNNNDKNADNESDSEPDYIFPESASRYLSAEDCTGMTAEQVRRGRNEIFARHGRLFDDKELREYFESKDWYNGYISAKNFSSSVLNKYERANVAFLKELEGRLS